MAAVIPPDLGADIGVDALTAANMGWPARPIHEIVVAVGNKACNGGLKCMDYPHPSLDAVSKRC